jgi:hypothetical protein
VPNTSTRSGLYDADLRLGFDARLLTVASAVADQQVGL